MLGLLETGEVDLAVVTLGSVWWYVTIYSQQTDTSAPVAAEEPAGERSGSGLAGPPA